MSEVSNVKCHNCKYSEPDKDGDLVCMRYPPTVIPIFDPQDMTTEVYEALPNVMPNHWCGEFEPKQS